MIAFIDVYTMCKYSAAQMYANYAYAYHTSVFCVYAYVNMRTYMRIYAHICAYTCVYMKKLVIKGDK